MPRLWPESGRYQDHLAAATKISVVPGVRYTCSKRRKRVGG